MLALTYHRVVTRIVAAVGIVTVVVGIVTVVVGLVLGEKLVWAIGLGVAVLGTAYAVAKPLVIVPGEVRVRPVPTSMLTRRYPIRSGSDLLADEKGLWYLPDGTQLESWGPWWNTDEVAAIRAEFGPHRHPWGADGRGAPRSTPPPPHYLA
ncbi:hypothetical protein ACPYO6_12555 [Georgenia sp. Z1344]|uniref:hypothetical protein n=1 Tax=Georgenia sp. Z1344 TaxID=3416706 RepID=UPI003CF6091A